jgi:hypothetical protein
LIGTVGDDDYYSFSSTAAMPNLEVTLSNLPDDYDLELYDSAGFLIALSNNYATTGESIALNGFSVGTYIAHVYGYSGASSSTSCYTFRANLSNTPFRLSSAMAEVSSKGAINFYPNPSTSRVSFDFYSPAAQIGTIHIVDQAGRVVRSESIAMSEGASKPSFDVSSLAPGMYFVRLTTKGASVTSRLMVKH